MADFTVNPVMNADLGCTINALSAPQPGSPVAPSSDISVKATGDPDLAPGQKRPAGAQKSIS